MLLIQREMHFAWVPVCLGIGIGLYFGQSREPDATFLAVLWIAGLLCILVRGRVNEALGPLLWLSPLLLRDSASRNCGPKFWRPRS